MALSRPVHEVRLVSFPLRHYYHRFTIQSYECMCDLFLDLDIPGTLLVWRSRPFTFPLYVGMGGEGKGLVRAPHRIGTGVTIVAPNQIAVGN